MSEALASFVVSTLGLQGLHTWPQWAGGGSLFAHSADLVTSKHISNTYFCINLQWPYNNVQILLYICYNFWCVRWQVLIKGQWKARKEQLEELSIFRQAWHLDEAVSWEERTPPSWVLKGTNTTTIYKVLPTIEDQHHKVLAYYNLFSLFGGCAGLQ